MALKFSSTCRTLLIFAARKCQSGYMWNIQRGRLFILRPHTAQQGPAEGRLSSVLSPEAGTGQDEQLARAKEGRSATTHKSCSAGLLEAVCWGSSVSQQGRRNDWHLRSHWSDPTRGGCQALSNSVVQGTPKSKINFNYAYGAGDEIPNQTTTRPPGMGN